MAGELLPPLADENYRCEACDFDYASVSVESAASIIGTVPEHARVATGGVPDELLRARPSPETWSIVEYLCHVRDVYATYTIRLFRTRTEAVPALEPMLNDLRVTRFRYNELDVDAMHAELRCNVSGFLDEIARVVDWDRVATRLPGEVRTARWLVRQAAHEGVHHLGDVENIRARGMTDL